MNNYQAAAAAAAAAAGFGPPASPHTPRAAGFPGASSPAPALDMYTSTPGPQPEYVQAASPQSSAFPTIAVSRAPITYNPVSIDIVYVLYVFILSDKFYGYLCMICVLCSS